MVRKQLTPYDITITTRDIGDGHKEITLGAPSHEDHPEWDERTILDGYRWAAGIIARVAYGRRSLDDLRRDPQRESLADRARRFVNTPHRCEFPHYNNHPICGAEPSGLLDPGGSNDGMGYCAEVTFCVPAPEASAFADRVQRTLASVLEADARSALAGEQTPPVPTLRQQQEDTTRGL